MKILLVSLVKEFIRANHPKKPKGTIFFRFPSLALASIVSLTPAEVEIEVVDEQISPIDFNARVDLVAITVPTAVANRAYKIADTFRKRGISVVLGGIHPTLNQEEALQHADAIIVGYADTTWPQLVSDFRNKNLKQRYIENPHCALDNLPTPRWDIFRNMGYINTNFVEATRGCPHKCSFCSTTAFYQSIHRTRPIEHVVRDIKKVTSFPKKFIFIVDDNIIGDKEYAKKLFKALAPLKICWISEATVDISEDEELVKLAAESGCFGLFLGFESISVQNIKSFHKPHNKVEKYRKTISLLHKYGISIEGGFIFGSDLDDASVFKETFEFLDKSNIDSFLSIYLTPMPGTPMYAMFKKQKRLITENYDLFDFRHMTFKPKNMTIQEVYDGVSWITMKFHSRTLVMKRILKKIGYFILHPSLRRLFGVVGLIAISLAFRKRIKDYAADGTFPKAFRNI